MHPRLRNALLRLTLALRHAGVYSLHLRLLLGFLLISLTTLGVGLISWWHQHQSGQLAGIQSLSAQLLLQVVRIQHAEADFGSAGLHDPAFFESGRHRSLEEHSRGTGQLMKGLDQLAGQVRRSFGTQVRDSALAMVGRMDSLAQDHATRFTAHADKLRERGFMGYGKLGQMREAAHRLEEMQTLDRAMVLQLRRHEKDYLLRRDLRYFHQGQAQVEEIAGRLPAVAQPQAGNLLATYKALFEEVVTMDRELGLVGGRGSAQEVGETSAAMGVTVEALDALVGREAARRATRSQWIFRLLMVASVALALLSSIYFSRLIVRPVREVAQFMAQEVEHSFKGERPLLRVRGKTEVGDLAMDANAMVARIRAQLKQIQEDREKLEGQYAQLTQLNSELNESHQRLASLLRVREKVHSIISHDLRGPINTMHAYLTLMAEQPGLFSKEETGKFAVQMAASVQRLSEMMENLLRWSLFHSGELQCKPRWINLNDATMRVLDLYQEPMAKKGIQVRNLIYSTWYVHADREMLEFILRNLISNAIKYSHQGGTLELNAADVGKDMLDIRVADTGTGMSSEAVDRILVQGEHLTTPGTQHEKGTGFGLMLCRDFVQHNGGRLWVESQPGKGTTVHFSLRFSLWVEEVKLQLDSLQAH